MYPPVTQFETRDRLVHEHIQELRIRRTTTGPPFRRLHRLVAAATRHDPAIATPAPSSASR